MAFTYGATLTQPIITNGRRFLASYAGRVSTTNHDARSSSAAGSSDSTSAFRLARDGWRVTLFDPDPGRRRHVGRGGHDRTQCRGRRPVRTRTTDSSADAVAAWRELARRAARRDRRDTCRSRRPGHCSSAGRGRSTSRRSVRTTWRHDFGAATSRVYARQPRRLLRRTSRRGSARVCSLRATRGSIPIERSRCS